MKHYLNFLFVSLMGSILVLASCSSDNNNGNTLSICSGTYYHPEYQHCVDGELVDGPEKSSSSSGGGGGVSSSSSASSSSGGSGNRVGACYLGYIESFYGCGEYMNTNWTLSAAKADCSSEESWKWLDVCPEGYFYDEYEPEDDIRVYLYIQDPYSSSSGVLSSSSAGGGSGKYCVYDGAYYSWCDAMDTCSISESDCVIDYEGYVSSTCPSGHEIDDCSYYYASKR